MPVYLAANGATYPPRDRPVPDNLLAYAVLYTVPPAIRAQLARERMEKNAIHVAWHRRQAEQLAAYHERQANPGPAFATFGELLAQIAARSPEDAE